MSILPSRFITSRLVVWLPLTALLLAFNLATAAPDLHSAPLPEIVPMKGMTARWVSKRGTLNGLPISTKEFSTKHTIEEIARFYKREWPRLGLNPPMIEFSNENNVVIFSKTGNYFYSIEAETVAGGGSQGQMMVSLAPDLVKVNKSTSFPLMPGSEVIMRIEGEDLGDQVETLMVSSPATVEQNYRFLVDKLKRAGWSLNTDTIAMIDGRVISGQRQQELLQVNIVPEDNSSKGPSSLLIHWTK